MVSIDKAVKQCPHILTIKSTFPLFYAEKQQQEISSYIRDTSPVYAAQFLKAFITDLEANDIEVTSDIWEAFFEIKELVRGSDDSVPYKVEYTLSNSTVVEIYENRAIMVNKGDTGHRTWESSLALAELICNMNDCNPSESIGCVIELGSGTGLVSMTLAKLQLAAKIYCTDGSMNVVNELQRTIDRCGLQDIVIPSQLLWEDLKQAEKFPKGADIFAGDILYGLCENYKTILDLLIFLEPRRVILSNPIRNAKSYEYFKTLCAEMGINAKIIKTLSGASIDDTDFMVVVSIPPIPIEIIELEFPLFKGA